MEELTLNLNTGYLASFDPSTDFSFNVENVEVHQEEETPQGFRLEIKRADGRFQFTEILTKESYFEGKHFQLKKEDVRQLTK